ncbi:hypothetical protein [Synechococcus elongatus]|uniref:Uncharacterized protein n=1 Tax=Synechococcus elongatus (strain ATCC 33912 / PCC 7942 / FACHB-805) TaxID=1140 RepID=Q31RY2_SYNE7|nr:hypothetical protein [Synechococcus elongatus]ABB56187.1 hypothetical protein Synpcc7942_0155 [Synechococcus elongatus PCC 7942 = FACHB-805]AJD56760.1 hypothetical protein M744_02285 [Synechococcus elongatus UTEX 2973]MBD2588019.1 hypothetical protein [Synechococcus elongatus FACHB-242]MBD2689087.1 hypothetical protein [Synechococcus elongatus FACHB-1061]MBD2707273.1 hypothetical protein [Synechococcus elongatus PCC 7942 = FACHB-805]
MKSGLFLLQLLGLSIAISWTIRELGPRFPLPATDTVALTLVLLPPLLLGVALVWRWRSLAIAASPQPQTEVEGKSP